MRRLAAWAFACSLCTALAGCGAQPEAAWLELHAVEPATLASGAALRVSGSGFPPGAPCELRLRGTSYGPGRNPRAVAATLRGRALSGELAAATFDEQAFGALGERGSFEGELVLAFPVRRGQGYVTGARHLRLELVPAIEPWPSAAAEQQLREHARRLLELTGIAVADEEPTGWGLVVGAASAHSRAASLGLRAGDVIERAGGASVRSLADLAPAPGARHLSLRIRRPGRPEPLALSLPLQGLFAPEVGVDLSRLSALVAWLLCCVLLLSPVPSPAPWLARAVLTLRHGPPPALGLWGAPRLRRASLLARARALLWPCAFSAGGVVLIWREPAGLLAVRSLSLYLGFAALSIALALTSGRGGRAQRARAALGIAGNVLVLGVLVACACALYGTRSFDGMVEGQGAWPYAWAVLQKPALLVAFPLYLVYAGRLSATALALEAHPPDPGAVEAARDGGSLPASQPRAVVPAARRANASGRRARRQPWATRITTRLRVAERVLTHVVLSAFGAAVFAGGWQSPLELPGVDPRLLGAVCFVLKAWLFAWLLALGRRLGWGERLSRRAVALACAASIALTWLWLWLEPDAVLELALGRALGASLLVFALVTAVRAGGQLARAPGVRRQPLNPAR